MFSLLLTWTNFWNNSRSAGVDKTSCVILYIFSFKFEVHTLILKYLREMNHDCNVIKISLRWYILSSRFAGKIFQAVIIFVFSLNVCTQICYDGWVGQIHWYLFCCHTSHMICFGISWVEGVGDWFTAAEVFHQHANTDIPVEWKWFITQITAMLITRWQKNHLNFEACWMYSPICNPNKFTLDHCETLEWPVNLWIIWHLLTQDTLGRCKKRHELLFVMQKVITYFIS